MIYLNNFLIVLKWGVQWHVNIKCFKILKIGGVQWRGGAMTPSNTVIFIYLFYNYIIVFLNVNENKHTYKDYNYSNSRVIAYYVNTYEID